MGKIFVYFPYCNRLSRYGQLINILNYIETKLKHRTKRKIITLGYVLAIIGAFILSLTNNNYVNASVSSNERFDYLELENLTTSQDLYQDSSVDNIRSLFNVVSSLVRHKKIVKEITVQKGDNLISILKNLSIDRSGANSIYSKIKQYYNPTDLKAGQKLSASLLINPQTEEIIEFYSLTLTPQLGERIVISLGNDGDYQVKKEKDELVQEINSATGEISGTLSQSMQRQGVPSRVINNFIQIFAYSIDFRKDVRKGDKFEIVYENQISPDGKIVKSGDILYAGLIMRKDRIGLYRFKNARGDVDYYTEKGLAMKRTLYKMPLHKCSRISSPFGKRYHPILKHYKIHWGVDYAAPYGTPILAGGDGVVQVAKYNGAYGNYVKIRHNSEFSTAYGHMKGFARGIAPGTRVTQGQVIGYVGSTGRSTGPHVHYEVVQNGRRVNPRTIKASAGENLSGANLNKFKKMVADIQTSYNTMFAQNNASQLAKK